MSSLEAVISLVDQTLSTKLIRLIVNIGMLNMVFAPARNMMRVESALIKNRLLGSTPVLILLTGNSVINSTKSGSTLMSFKSDLIVSWCNTVKITNATIFDFNVTI